MFVAVEAGLGYCKGIVDTKVIKVDGAKPDAEVLLEAARVVDAGGLVGIPTETVYGIACRVRDDSLERLNSLKGRTPDKYYTLHIGRKEEVARYVPLLSARAQKLVRKGWPGPLTIVFEMTDDEVKKRRSGLEDEVFRNLYRDNSIGVRCPDNAVAARFLTATKEAVVAPSANLTGQEPASEAGQVLRQFNGLVELILDGGRCRYGKSSTVVKIGRDGPQILREGVYTKEDIGKMSEMSILFVCTGNTCRSPAAEGFFAKYLAEKLGHAVDELGRNGYKIVSAGTMGAVGWPATAEAVKACAKRGVDIRGHRSAALSTELIEDADYIYVMTQAHRRMVLGLSSEGRDERVRLLGDEDIPDPIGQGQEVYDKCAEMIEKAVKKRVNEVLK